MQSFHLARALLVAAPLAVLPAQENYEIQVYPSRTADKGSTFFELHSNYTGRGSVLPDGTVLPTNGALHETIEITHGFTDVFELGFYVFTAANQGKGLEFVGVHIRPRIRAPESWKLPVGLSLSTELGPVSAMYDANTWGIELRPIVDQTIGRFYWAFNPVVGWALDGPDAGHGVDGMVFNPNVKLQWQFAKVVAGGIEYYGTTGTITRMAPSDQQSHLIFPSLDFSFSDDWELNVGYGVKVAGTGDHDIVKVIVGRRVSF